MATKSPYKTPSYQPSSYEKQLFGDVDGTKVKNKQAWYEDAWNKEAAAYKAQYGLSDDIEKVKGDLKRYHQAQETNNAFLDSVQKKQTTLAKQKQTASEKWLKSQTKAEQNYKPNLYKEYLKIGGTEKNPTQSDYDWQVAYNDRKKTWDQSHKKTLIPKVKKEKEKSKGFSGLVGGTSNNQFDQMIKLMDKTDKNLKKSGKKLTKENRAAEFKKVENAAFTQSTQDGIGRFGNRIINSATFGLTGELDKKNRGAAPYLSERKFGDGGGTDMLADLVGFAVPGGGEVKGTQAILKGAKFLNGASKAAKIAKIATEGATVMGMHSLGQIGAREAINPKDYTLKDDAKLFGENVATGAIGDLVIRGGGKLVGKGVGKILPNPKIIQEDQAAIQKLTQEQTEAELKRRQPVKNLADKLLNLRKEQELKKGAIHLAEKLKKLDPSVVQAEMEAAQSIPKKVGLSKAEQNELNHLTTLDDFLMSDKEIERLQELQAKKKGTPLVQKTGIDKVLGLEKNDKTAAEGILTGLSNSPLKGGDLKNEIKKQLQNNFQEKTVTSVDESIKEVKKAIRDSRIKLTDEIKGNIPDFNAAKKAHFGKVTFSKNGSDVDSLYNELAERFPHIFDGNVINPMDRLTRIMEVANSSAETNQKFLLDPKAIDDATESIYTHLTGGNAPKFPKEWNQKAAWMKQKEILDEMRIPETISESAAETSWKPSDMVAYSEPRFEYMTPPKKAAKMVKMPLKEGEGAILEGTGEVPSTIEHLTTKTKKEKFPFSYKARQGKVAFTDNAAPFKEIDKLVEKAKGSPLKTTDSTYQLALNSRNADMIARGNITEKMSNETGEIVGDSLKDVLKQSKHPKEFADYLTNRHAITRMERGEKVYPDKDNVTIEGLIKQVAEYEKKYPQFKELGKKWDQFQQNSVKVNLVHGGLYPEEEAEKMMAANPHYATMYREFSPTEMPKGQKNTKGFANVSNQIKAAPGSQRKIVSPIEGAIINEENRVKARLNNRVMRTFIDHLTNYPKALEGIAEIVPTEELSEVQKAILHPTGNDGFDEGLSAFNGNFQQKPDLSKGNIVYGLVDGEKVYVKVHDPLTLEAITSLGPKAQGNVLKFLGNATRIMKTFTTGMNPIFGLTKNVFRDIPTAFINSKTTNNPFTFSKDLVEAFVQSFLPNNETLRWFRSVGGGHSSSISSGANLLARTLKEVAPQEGAAAKTKKALSLPLHMLEGLNNRVEMAPRLAEFKRIAKKGNDESIQKALFEANDLTVNFNKFGNVGKEIDQFIPYFNASIQGIEKFVRSFKENPTKVVTKATATITLPTIALYLLNKDNPEYQKLSNQVKDNYFTFPKSDGTFIKIPKPRELGVFSTGVERILRQWEMNDPQAFKGFGEYVLDNFIPPRRTILAPFNDIRANSNYFGSPIVPGNLNDGRSPRYQYDSADRVISKKLGNMINQSPKKIDYLLDSYGGGIADISKGLGGDVSPSKAAKYLGSKFIADPVFSNDTAKNFYDRLGKLKTAQTNYKKLGEGSKDLNPKLYSYLNQVNNKLRDIRKEQKRIRNDQTLSGTEKEKQLRTLQKLINKLEEEANKAK